MRPLECLVIPELAELQDILEGMRYANELQKVFEGYDYNHTQNYGLERACRDPALYLNRMFVWNHTTQGHHFWREIYDRLFRPT